MTVFTKVPSRAKPWSVLGVLGLAFGLLFMATQVAFAHANLIKANPAPDSALSSSPSRVQIWFSEPLAPAYSRIQVLDSTGKQVDKGDSAVDPADPTIMYVSVGTLLQGVYTVAWQSVSNVDGHKVVDSFVFSVGQPLSTQPSNPTKQPLLQYPLDPVIRWFVLLGALALFGGLAFDLAVAGPALAKAGQSNTLQKVRTALSARHRRLLWIALAATMVASLIQLLFEASNASGVPLAKVLDSPTLSFLGNTQWGKVWLWRLAASLALGGLFFWAFPREQADAQRPRRSLPKVASLGMAGVLLLTFSLVSHGAALPEIKGQALFSDYLHLLGTGLWFGGLLHLATSIPLLMKLLPEEEKRPILAALIPRFSLAAALGIGTLIITGFYSAWAQVTVLPALGTPYGTTLLVKVALVAPMLLLAAANLLWVGPRLKRKAGSLSWLARFVTAEAVLGLLVLASVGLLTSLEPARQAAAAKGIGVSKLAFNTTSEGLIIATSLDPGVVGQNAVLVTLKDAQGNPVDSVLSVDVTMTYLDADLGQLTGTAKPLGKGQYRWDRVLLSVAGGWQGSVTVRRDNAFDAHSAFRFLLAQGSGAAPTIVPDARTGKLLLALELGLIGVVFTVAGFFAGGMATKGGLAILSAGTIGIIAGVALAANLLSATPPILRNPFPPDEASLARGSALYVQNCQSCHGPFGHGDGPGAANLNPKPFDLVIHVPMHPDDYLFTVISDGIPGTAMPSFKSKFSSDDIWSLINYLRSLR